MRASMSKEEEAVIKLLQHILSERGVTYETAALKGLLSWAREQGHLPTVNSAFEIPEWEDIGKELWEEFTKGSKELTRYGPLWRVLVETLKSMKAERQVTASAFAALVGGETENKKGGTGLASQFLFAIPPIPLPASVKVAAPLKSSASASGRMSVTNAPVPWEAVSSPKPSAEDVEGKGVTVTLVR
ncbi:hypothetical protein BTVI_10492 [Pitangus sulphuratus]|nr:hypothetical protein BTVI_10492 [Pitangus sulphuratus]